MISNRTLLALRFGFGFKAGQPEPSSVDDVLGNLLTASQAYPNIPIEGVETRLDVLRDLHRNIRNKGKISKTERKEAARYYDRVVYNLWLEDIHAKIVYAVESPHGFYERLVNFWTSHFAISTNQANARRGLISHYETTALRPHLTGKFSDLLWHAETHPAMVHYLDQHRSIGPNSKFGLRKKSGLNENHAREILELHTLGVNGGYTQTDVRELAKLMTGIGLRKGLVDFIYRPDRAEPGSETILGRQYGGSDEKLQNIRAVLDDLARHPATAHFISWKLARHFVADSPPRSLVDRMAQAFLATDGYLPEVYAVMLSSQESRDTFGAKVRQPLDFIITGLRAVGANPRTLAPRIAGKKKRNSALMQMDVDVVRKRPNPKTFVPLRRMNQPLWLPKGPDGWPEEADHWITPQGLAERIQWARRIGNSYKIADPRGLLENSLREAVTSDTLKWVSAAATKTEGVILALTSPEFNRR